MSATSTELQRRFARRVVLTLGFVSLLTDAASDMVWPLLPIFLAEHLHRSVAYAGLIEGVAEGTSALGKYLAGRYSDRLPRKKPLVLFGYGISSLVRPLVAFAMAPVHALLVRFVDRVGKGIRSAPRDALLAASVPDDQHAAAFGLHRALDSAGAVLGPLLASLVLWFRPNDLRTVFASSAIPGALAMLALWLLVPEIPTPPPSSKPTAAKSSGTARLPRTLHRYLFIVTVFTLANATDFFLLARARQLGMPTAQLPMLWALLSLLRALAAQPGGRIADRIGRGRALLIGWCIYGVVYSLFAIVRTPLQMVACIVLYSGFYGLTEGAERALVATLAPPDARGHAYGLFALCTGIAAVIASLGFGLLWSQGLGNAAFAVCGGLALVAAALLWIERRRDPALR